MSAILVAAPVLAVHAQKLPGAEIVIVDPVTDRVLPVDAALLSLRKREITVQPGDSLRVLLRSNGIVPDGEAFAVVYELNPALTTARVDAGTRLWLPVIDGPVAARHALASGHVAYITVDLSEKLRLLDGIASLSRVVDSLQPEIIAHSVDTSASRQLLPLAQSINEKARSIGLSVQARTRPIDSALVNLISDEIHLANHIFSTIRNQRDGASPDDISTLRAISVDLELRQKYWTDTLGPAAAAMLQFPRVAVEIHTMGTDGSEIKGLRVYWIEEALRTLRRPTPFLSLSSPISDLLREGDYVMWGAGMGDTTRSPVTEILERIQIRRRCLPGAKPLSSNPDDCLQSVTIGVPRKP